MNIRERVLARRDLDQMRANREIDKIAIALNAECVEGPIPARATLYTIMDGQGHVEVLQNLLEEAAAGQDVSATASALLSEDGLEVFDIGFVPPLVNQTQVAEELYYPDGRER